MQIVEHWSPTLNVTSEDAAAKYHCWLLGSAYFMPEETYLLLKHSQKKVMSLDSYLKKYNILRNHVPQRRI